MITKSQAKRKQDIKTKLMAAIAMLLVSSIMMVSSTYAWFTLSTAPEVTGITTAVGANGNLEMALMPTDGLTSSITSAAGDSVLATEAKNVTWGNLVDLSDTNVYGLDKITLYPSEVNIDASGKLNTTAMLKTPTYGADGRVVALASNTTTAIFGGTTVGFKPNADANKTDHGVRAVGVISGMTDRQLDYRNARQAANTASSMAKNSATNSLSTNGNALANVVIKKATQGDSATFTATDVDSLKAIVKSLLGDNTTTGSLGYVEEAYMQYLLALAASEASGEPDTAWSAVKGEIEKTDSTLATVMALFGEDTLPSELTTAIAKFNDFDDADIDSTVEKVQEADTLLKALPVKDSYTWGELSSILNYLADANYMKVNGFTAEQIKANMGDLVSSVTEKGGLTVTISPGGGVYADIADHCGNFTASVTIDEVTYAGVTLNDMKARMETAAENSYLNTISAVFNLDGFGAPASTGEVRPISDMYGYVVDLAFRTNAAESNLLIAKDATDRIYGSDNTNNETMGHGSSMTFKATTTSFGNEQVKGLMDAIRIIFFNPGDGSIYAKGKLDTANASVGADGITAKISLYSGDLGATGTTYVPATGSTVGTHKQVEKYTAIADIENWIEDIYAESEGTYTKIDKKDVEEGTTYYSFGYEYVELTDEEKNDSSITKYVAVTSGSDAGEAIMPLTQNQAQALSVLVYLDGNLVGNDDVAATAAQSVTGKMNLQFKSSATLVPMEYADLHTPAQGSGTTGGTDAGTGTTGENTNP